MRLTEKKSLDKRHERWDLEIRGMANFVAEGAVVHNSNSRYVFQGGVMHAGSRTEWKKEYPDYSHVTVDSLLATGKVERERAEDIVAKLAASTGKNQNMWWKALDGHPEVRAFCEANPGVVVYAECYGAVQDLKYGCKPGEVKLAVFDLMQGGRWLDVNEARTLGAKLPWVPALTPFAVNGDRIETQGMPYDFERICELAEGRSLVFGSDNVREGCVVKPLKERYHPAIGRVNLKWVSAAYLERSK